MKDEKEFIIVLFVLAFFLWALVVAPTLLVRQNIKIQNIYKEAEKAGVGQFQYNEQKDKFEFVFKKKEE